MGVFFRFWASLHGRGETLSLLFLFSQNSSQTLPFGRGSTYLRSETRMLQHRGMHPCHVVPVVQFLHMAFGPLTIGAVPDCKSMQWYAVAEPAPGEPLHAAYSHAAQRPESGVRPVRGILYMWIS
ncbi:hypothetical protein B0H65DRAFT_305849 [Neurospora tetraspora]|uniref:Uncharacterized protein n=1 Tax=Neurospora tetraspora TaxID=94610 RepID=A0AAE0MN71_9PEZI|nr:hypothetical protein B0H65DRAFT_305849 [Neurospora tetraspora]